MHFPPFCPPVFTPAQSDSLPRIWEWFFLAVSSLVIRLLCMELLEWEQLSFIALLLGPFVYFITFILAATHEIDGDI